MLTEEQQQTLDELAPKAWQGHQIDYSCCPPSVTVHQDGTEGSAGSWQTGQLRAVVCNGMVFVDVRLDSVPADRASRRGKHGGKRKMAKRP